MSARPFSKIFAPLGGLLAAIGLVVVAALTTPDMTGRTRLNLEACSAALVEIVRALRPRVVPAGAVICRKGETGDQMFFIVEGRVSIATPNPVELGAGSFFGEMALITGEPRSATEVSLLLLYSEDFQMLSSSNPEIAEIIRKTALERRGATPKA
ncbi:CRP-like cAMP-binding protein [Ensifer sp. 4252]